MLMLQDEQNDNGSEKEVRKMSQDGIVCSVVRDCPSQHKIEANKALQATEARGTSAITVNDAAIGH